jgi:hypothetical protein
MLKGPFTRIAGPIVFLVLLGLMIGLRIAERHRADGLLEGETTARRMIAALHEVSLDAVGKGQQHPGLHDELLAGLPDLTPLPDLGLELITYAHDDVYMYGVAANTSRNPETGEISYGYILRAWPLRYGRTGDAEFQLSESGVLWEGQNRLGRSGTDYGYPPAFPEPEVGQPGAAWWPIRLPTQR